MISLWSRSERQCCIGSLRKLYQWKRTRGLFIEDTSIDGKLGADDALEYFSKQKEPALLILWDIHHDFSDPTIIRWLRDLSISMGILQQNIILISPKLKVPDDLEKSITVIDVSLPEQEEVSRLLNVLCGQQKIDLDPIVFERFVRGALGLTEEEIKRLFSRILISGNRFSEDPP